MSIVTKESNPELYNALFSEDEIKEILDKLNNKAEHYILYNYEVKLLLDYITNLQEEIHKKEAMYDSLAVDYRLSQEENERLKQSILNAIDKMNSEMVMINDKGYYYTDISALEDILQTNDKDFIDYKQRIDKAIEYINKTSFYYKSHYDFKNDLLNILNGGDEE